jgi:hypothetical protein
MRPASTATPPGLTREQVEAAHLRHRRVSRVHSETLSIRRQTVVSDLQFSGTNRLVSPTPYPWTCATAAL